MAIDKVTGIITETKKNGYIGFIYALLLAIVTMGFVIGYLWRDSNKCRIESAAKLDAVRVEYNRKLEAKIMQLENVQSEVRQVKENVNEKKPSSYEKVYNDCLHSRRRRTF